DGIRDGHVTGVQTCALPISQRSIRPRGPLSRPPHTAGPQVDEFGSTDFAPLLALLPEGVNAERVWLQRIWPSQRASSRGEPALEIGRASCRERGETWGVSRV